MSPNLLSYFRLGQTRSETKTLQIVLESFCVHSPAHAFFCFILGRLLLLALPVLLEICLLLLWSPPFPPHALALILLSLAHLDSLPPYDLVLWIDGSVRFPFGKGGSGVFANCSLCGIEATLSFSAGPVCSSFSTETCAILHALCWSRQHQQVCHFSSLLLLCDSRSILASLSSPPSFLLSQTLWQIWQKLSSLSFCSIRLQWVPGYSFLPEKDATDKLIRRGVLLAPYAILCSLSPPISGIHFWLFSDWRRTVSSKYFDTQVSSISTEELVLPRHARCVLSRLRWNGRSLLLSSYLSRIGRIENPCCSACGHPSQDISHLILHCPATDSAPLILWRLSVFLRPLVQALGSFPASGAPWSSAMPPSLGRGRVINSNMGLRNDFSLFVLGSFLRLCFR